MARVALPTLTRVVFHVVVAERLVTLETEIDTSEEPLQRMATMEMIVDFD